MPYNFDPTVCKNCPFGYCFEDRRDNPVRGRSTQFRIRQEVATKCTLGSFIPGFSLNSELNADLNIPLQQLTSNVRQAGRLMVGPEFSIQSDAVAKVEGDIGELLEAAVLWNTAAAWNVFMDTGKWPAPSLNQPDIVTPDPRNKIAIVQLPRRFDPINLFSVSTRAPIDRLKDDLHKEGMELGLSTPDIVGVRLPQDVAVLHPEFSTPLTGIDETAYRLLSEAHNHLHGRVEQHGFLFAMAVKRTTRSDRLYQPLFEANVLKYLIHHLLQSSTFKFYAHNWSGEGANAIARYRAAALYSLTAGSPERAIDYLLDTADPTLLGNRILEDISQMVTTLAHNNIIPVNEERSEEMVNHSLSQLTLFSQQVE